MFANIEHSITDFNEHLFDVYEDCFKWEKRLCLAGWGPDLEPGAAVWTWNTDIES